MSTDPHLDRRTPTAAELARALRAPTYLCPKCIAPMWYRQVCSSAVHVCEGCGWLTFDPEQKAIRA